MTTSLPCWDTLSSKGPKNCFDQIWLPLPEQMYEKRKEWECRRHLLNVAAPLSASQTDVAVRRGGSAAGPYVALRFDNGKFWGPGNDGVAAISSDRWVWPAVLWFCLLHESIEDARKCYQKLVNNWNVIATKLHRSENEQQLNDDTHVLPHAKKHFKIWYQVTLVLVSITAAVNITRLSW